MLSSVHPSRVLVANRGEIAQRVVRSIQRCGLVPVTVHTPLESRIPSDGAISVSVPSYLDSSSVIAAAKKADAIALHPGYGFLSENADFAEDVIRAGLVWIGPPPSAMRLLADKRAARHTVAKAGVPVLPSVEDSVGTRNSLSDAALAMKAESTVGFPAIVKPACGGGGKGMHIARSRDELVAAIATARREGRAAFGAGTGEALLIERYVENARHIEVQIFGDKRGNIIHLGDRDCSVQRRNQKIVEIAPAPHLSDKVRARLRSVAVEAARAAKYVGAGTVEFLVEDTGKFWFLEINARLQVEHPVTEMVTGLDLVQWQIDVAMGRPLPITQQRRVPFKGYAVEARLCAEDPRANFAPSAGRITRLRLPAPGPGLRVDSGVAEGDTVSVWYDPLLAKIIAWGATAEEAIARLGEALTRCQISGISTNIDLLRALATNPASPLVAGKPVHINYLKKNTKVLLAGEEKTAAVYDPTFVAAALAAHAAAPALRGEYSALSTPGWRIDSGTDELAWKPLHASQKERARVSWLKDAPGSFMVSRTNGAVVSAPKKAWASVPRADGSFDLQVDSVFYPSVSVVSEANSGDNAYGIFSKLGKTSVQKLDPVEEDVLKANAAVDAKNGAGNGAKASAGAAAVKIGAPLTARVAKVLVKVGDKVKSGQKLAILEAMKMEHVITSPCNGTVKSINCTEGEITTQGDYLFNLN